MVHPAKPPLVRHLTLNSNTNFIGTSYQYHQDQQPHPVKIIIHVHGNELASIDAYAHEQSSSMENVSKQDMFNDEELRNC